MVSIGPPVAMGETPAGRTRFIPIIGGIFEGPRISGEVIPGGADWQTVRPDGTTLIEAIYAIRAADGTVIGVRNRGLVAQDGETRYVRTIPSFEAPKGPHDWLNRSVFVGTIAVANPERTAVRIGVFRVV